MATLLRFFYIKMVVDAKGTKFSNQPFFVDIIEFTDNIYETLSGKCLFVCLVVNHVTDWVILVYRDGQYIRIKTGVFPF